MGATLDLTSIKDLVVLTTGAGDVSVDGLRHFVSETQRLLSLVQSTDRSNPSERQDAKQEFIALMRDFMWLPTVACIVYVILVCVGPFLVRRPWPVRLRHSLRLLQMCIDVHRHVILSSHKTFFTVHACDLQVKWLLSLWNLALTIFSAVGSYHCMGALLLNMQNSGWRYTVCTLPKTIDLVGTDLDVWVCYFVLSKIAEFFDTVLKILLKKKIIFLHWYHHLATAWLCWNSIAYDFAPGMWIAALNYSVHALMYLYFFLSSILNKYWFDKICRPVAPFITTIQISQMAVFTVVNVSAVYYLFFDTATYGEPCNVKVMNLYINALVVLSYLFLFLALFFAKYMYKGGTIYRSNERAGVRHVVLLKLRDEATAEERAAIVDGLNTLPSKIPQISSYKVGEQINAVDDGRNMTLGVVAEFASEADYKIYASHPEHIAVITNTIKPVLATAGRNAIQYPCVTADSGPAVSTSAGVRHVVLLKLKDATTMVAEMDEIIAGLSALPSKIPQIKSYKIGIQIEEIDDGRNMSIGLVADFENEAGYKIYANHPEHVAVIMNTIKPALAPGGRSALQFPCCTNDNTFQNPLVGAIASTTNDLRRSPRLRKKAE